ncbi:OLC1v1021904C1 [Oldenlandia corymbosa var. corymbosa]|nr:OLC1v1021904C1 [Oldenlandia corymbosa var. corymbosa]
MGSENLSLFGEIKDQFEGMGGAQKISVSHHQVINGVEAQKTSDSFVVDIERFASHFATDKDINANSRITLQRNLSRKGSQQQRGGAAEKKSNFTTNGDRENGSLAISPRASLLHGGSTPEKPMVVMVGATDHHAHNPQVHNPITIVTGSLAGGAAAMAEGKGVTSTISRKFSFRRSSSAFFDPRKILLFFATLSSMGTILLIYFTLSMNKLNGVDDGLN